MTAHRVTVTGTLGPVGMALPPATFCITDVEPMEAHRQAMDRYRQDVLRGQPTPGAHFVTAREEG